MKISKTHHRTKVGIIKKNPSKKIILHRQQNGEDIGASDSKGGVWLWYIDNSGRFIVSLVGKKGDITTRISTPEKIDEFAHPFADVSWTRHPEYDWGDSQRYRDRIRTLMKREFGYDVELRG